jgi:putative transcriptional regulator
MTEMELAGQLLVATPQLRGSTFDRAVILLLSHADDGALGVMLNRPSDVPVGRLLPKWEDLAADPPVVFQGGPVGTDSALALVLIDGPGEPLGVRRVGGEVGILDLDTPPEVVEPAVSGLRVFAGYAGWAPDQLDDEVSEGSWYVVDAEPRDAFRPDSVGLWRTVLKRQSGDLALMASFPEDPTMN